MLNNQIGFFYNSGRPHEGYTYEQGYFQVVSLLCIWIRLSLLLHPPICVLICVWAYDACCVDFDVRTKHHIWDVWPGYMRIDMPINIKVIFALLDLIRVRECVCELLRQVVRVWATRFFFCSLYACIRVLVWSLVWLLFSLSPKPIKHTKAFQNIKWHKKYS